MQATIRKMAVKCNLTRKLTDETICHFPQALPFRGRAEELQPKLLEYYAA